MDVNVRRQISINSREFVVTGGVGDISDRQASLSYSYLQVFAHICNFCAYFVIFFQPTFWSDFLAVAIPLPLQTSLKNVEIILPGRSCWRNESCGQPSRVA